MPSPLAIARALRARLWRVSVQEEVDEELAFHLEMRTREYVARGMTPAAAREAALQRFGDMERVNATCRRIGNKREVEMRRTEWLEELRQDVAFGLRQLTKSPLFTLVAVVTLALGIGANTAIFSVVNGVLLRALPFRDPDRLVRVYPMGRGERNAFSVLNYLDWRDQSQSFSGMAASAGRTLNLTSDAEPERLRASQVTANLFQVLGVGAALGRTFAPGEDAAGAPRVAVLAHALWQRRFGGDPGIVGRQIRLNGEPYTVVGIAPRSGAFPRTAELWIPFVFDSTTMDPRNRGAQYLGVIGRLKPGVTIEAAHAETADLAKRLAAHYPRSNASLTDSQIQRLQEQMVGEVRPALLALLAAVGLVLLIACANVANLLLVRATARETEIAVRTALGAGRGRLVRQLLTESIILALVGGVAGVCLAAWAVRLLVRFGPVDIPRLAEVSLDGRVLLATAAVAILTGVLFGLIPALQATSPELARTLREGGRGARNKVGSNRVRGTLVVTELALSVMLLAGAGLMIRSFQRLSDVDLGFRPTNVMTFNLSLPDEKYDRSEKVRRFTSAMLERMRDLPGVVDVGVIYGLPLAGTDFTISLQSISGHPTPAPGEAPSSLIRPASPGYFRAMGIRVSKGRLPQEDDRFGSRQVVVINEAFARRFFAGEEAMGRTIRLGWTEDSVRMGGEVVGIIGDVRSGELREEPAPELYMPFDQAAVSDFAVVARTTGSPSAFVSGARGIVKELDRDLPLFNVKTMDERVGEAAAGARFYTSLLAIFAAAALLLAAVGIYGVMSYAVSQRTPEIGIRIALGARSADVLRLVVGQGMLLALLGLSIGVAGALASGRVIASLLFGVSSSDLVTFLGVALVLASVAFLASYLPARRAARTDPMVALRS